MTIWIGTPGENSNYLSYQKKNTAMITTYLTQA